MLESMKKADKKIIIMGGMVLGIIVIFIIAIFVVSLSSGGKLSFEKIEKKLVSAAESYYEDNEDALPEKVGKSAEIDSDELVSGGYIKDLSEFTDEDVVCSGKVIVGKTESGYDYVASLDCGEDYKTEFLADKLIEEDVVTSGEGLYKMEDVVEYGTTLGMDEDGYDLSTNELMTGYIYRGEDPDNYVKIEGDNNLYRIVKIDGNKDITLFSTYKKQKGKFDTNYNTEAQNNYGINEYPLSAAYNSLKDYYESDLINEYLKSKVVTKNVCVGARSVDETSTDGSVECSVVQKDQAISLIPVFDIMNASLSDACETTVNKECQNYNYLIKDVRMWTMTPSTENSYTGYRVASGIVASRSSESTIYGHVYYLSNRVIFAGGTGTEKDPFILK
ncbi:MAG: hypothetical protein IJN90_03050 [Bacilli bacterium]|nr:hypothetical protein [Bacilli bacterium]